MNSFIICGGTPEHPATNLPRIHTPPPLVMPENVTFFDDGADAGFTIGNSTLRMHYEEALRFSQKLRLHAKRAKRRCGDVSRHWSALGILDELKG
jgi:hypothetical protein